MEIKMKFSRQHATLIILIMLVFALTLAHHHCDKPLPGVETIVVPTTETAGLIPAQTCEKLASGETVCAIWGDWEMGWYEPDDADDYYVDEDGYLIDEDGNIVDTEGGYDDYDDDYFDEYTAELEADRYDDRMRQYW